MRTRARTESEAGIARVGGASRVACSVLMVTGIAIMPARVAVTVPRRILSAVCVLRGNHRVCRRRMRAPAEHARGSRQPLQRNEQQEDGREPAESGEHGRRV